MSDFVNPYLAGRPIESPGMFYGRDDALIWVEQQLTLDRRFLIAYGPDLIGKTSLIRRLPAVLPKHIYCLYFECKPHEDRALPQVWAALAGELADQLMAQGLVSPHQVDTAVDSAAAVEALLRHAGPDQNADPSQGKGTYRLLLVLDDAHRVAGTAPSSTASFFDFLTNLLTEVPALHVLLTLSDLSYDQLTHSLPINAMAFRLGPLRSDAAQQLITRPAQGALRFDAGVVKRIAEITSNHPYYLHLFCYTLYNYCAHKRWINQSDIDQVLKALLNLPNEPFQAIWEQSNRAEQAALTALAGLKGAHGPITRQEVTNYLRRFDTGTAPDVIFSALESLADRGVLVRMGALSYRFSVNLFRYWLDYHTDPAQVLHGANWTRLSAQFAQRPASEEVEPVESPGSSRETQEERTHKRGSTVGRLVIGGLTATALLGVVLLALASRGMLPVEIVSPTPTEMPTQQSLGGFASPVPTPTSTSVPTPTPTRPLVVARSLPAIVYMARGGTDSVAPATWDLFVMDADGTNRRQRTDSNADDITPIWSPDGQRIAFVSQRDGNRDIYMISADTLTDTQPVNITRHPSEDWTPAWSPDGQKIAFSSNRQGNWEIFIVNPDGTDLRQITNDGEGNLSPVWSPDGQTMAYASKRDGDWEIYTMPAPDVQGQLTGERRRLTFSTGNDLSPLFSPTGSRIAFESNREGNVEIYVMNADGSNQQNLSNLPSADDHGPVWSPDEQRLVFYSNREGNWDLFVMNDAGEGVINLTSTLDSDEQAPAWRP